MFLFSFTLVYGASNTFDFLNSGTATLPRILFFHDFGLFSSRSAVAGSRNCVFYLSISSKAL